MIIAAFDEDEKQQTVIVLVMENDNLARMRAADPITLVPRSFGGIYSRHAEFQNCPSASDRGL